MINASILRSAGIQNYHVRENITLEMIGQQLMKMNGEEYGIPIQLYMDQIKSGGFFNSTFERCLVIKNAQHPSDYLSYCITIRKQGMWNIIMMSCFGISAQTMQARRDEERRRNGTLGGLIINAFSGVNQAEYQAEHIYYDMVREMFCRLFH